ncbi:MAG: tol-pal system protein YbgF [Myxococcales bacterium]|nr:tol-pal system protein YbgF [Deltaproteobacteria bacterium]NNE17541.1 tol-pal system protein YbgF [Myxococcales bacterium]
MKTLFAVASVSTLIGCSSVGAHSNARTASDEAARGAELTALRLQFEEQEQELRTVRGQLALARAEVQELKGHKSLSSQPVTKSASDVGLPWAANGEGELAMEPVLRIDGEIVDERLPTTADIPEMPDFVEPRADTPPRRSEVNVEGYRRALSLIREQKFDEALMELDAFASEHPSHPYTDNALYWSGEIHYLRHDYDRALEYFQRIEKLHAWENKAPDALYRIGQIYLRRGDTARAQAYFDKVREQFPNTAAARLALREDAS